MVAVVAVVESVVESEFAGFVASEVRQHASSIDEAAAEALVQAVGHDLRALAGAAHQLTNDFPGQPLTVDKVKKYFGGRAEAKSFAVADAAFWGRREIALEELRWALDGGTAPVLVTSAFAGSARGVARYKAAPRGMREADLGEDVGERLFGHQTRTAVRGQEIFRTGVCPERVFVIPSAP